MALAMLIPFAHNIVFGVAFCTTLILFVLAAVGLQGGDRQGRGLAEPPAGLADIQSCGDDADCADRPLVCADGGEPRRADLGGSGH